MTVRTWDSPTTSQSCSCGSAKTMVNTIVSALSHINKDVLCARTYFKYAKDQLSNETPFAYAKRLHADAGPYGMGRARTNLDFEWSLMIAAWSLLLPVGELQPFLTFGILKTWPRPWSKSDSWIATFCPNEGNVVAPHGFSEHLVLTTGASFNYTLTKKTMKQHWSLLSSNKQKSKSKKPFHPWSLRKTWSLPFLISAAKVKVKERKAKVACHVVPQQMTAFLVAPFEISMQSK